MRIRQGNDFIFLWAIERNGLPEDFSNAVNIRLHFKNFDRVSEVKSFQIVDGNIVRVEVSPEWASRLGAYSLILSYAFEDESLADNDRKCVVDVLAFNIVSKTSEADDVTEMAKTTDIMIGLSGLSAYEVWLKDNPDKTKEEYYNWLRQPATDAVSLIEDKIETLDTAIQQEEQRELAEGVRLSNEQSRVDAEGLRVSGEVARNTAEGIRVGNESTRVDNEGIRLLAEEDRIDAEETRVENETLRISAELLREGAESDREDAEQLRQTNTSTAIQNANEATQNANSAAELANTKAGEANTAAQNANGAREAIQSDLGAKAFHGYESIEVAKTLKQVDEAKVDKSSIVGETGQGETSVMHQKAVTDELGTKASHGYDSSPKTLKEVDDDLVQLDSDVNLFKEESNLKDAIQDSKIKDIESIISTMNPNQSAQLSVSGASPLSLPKNAANGGMEVKLEGLTAENLVVNGDFRDGLNGWKAYFTELVETDNNILVFRANGSGTARVQREPPIVYTTSDIIYMSAKVKATSNSVGIGLAANNLIKHSGSGNWETLSRRGAISNGYLSVVDERASGWDNVFVKDYLGINLTATFGAGNEPTKEQCDLIFSDYFEGVKSFIPTGRVRSVGKNLANPLKMRVGSSTSTGIEDGEEYLEFYNPYYQVINSYSTLGMTLKENTSYTISAIGKKITGSFSILALYADGTFDILTSTNNINYTRIQAITDGNRTLRAIRFGVANSEQISRMLLNSVQIEEGIKLTPYEPYKETNLYLTAPELRSNGTVKNEIRKGANGYELVKRVGVGTSNGEIVEGGDFSDPTKWVIGGDGTSIISNGTLKLIAVAGMGANARQSKTITAGKIYRYKIDVLSLTGVVYFYIGDTQARVIQTPDSGKTISGFFLSSTGGTQIRLVKEFSSNVSGEFDNISIFEYNPTEGVAIAGGEAVYGGNIHYTLATPVITPISYGGVLNSAENGTVYHEPIIADAGVYDTNLPILMQDYPIATIEEIIKHENGIDNYLNVVTAVIASDGLSFTHPDLTSGDLVLFTYAFDKESTNGNITASFYDSNVVKIDTVTGKAYRINEVVTNGVLTRTLTEV